MYCPKCQSKCKREDVDVGVGVISGPYGCPTCGWSASPEYDLSTGRKYTENGYMLDQYGCAYPPGNRAYMAPDKPMTAYELIMRLQSMDPNKEILLVGCYGATASVDNIEDDGANVCIISELCSG